MYSRLVPKAGPRWALHLSHTRCPRLVSSAANLARSTSPVAGSSALSLATSAAFQTCAWPRSVGVNAVSWASVISVSLWKARVFSGHLTSALSTRLARSARASCTGRAGRLCGALAPAFSSSCMAKRRKRGRKCRAGHAHSYKERTSSLKQPELAERQRCGCCESNTADVRGAEGVLRGSSWDTRVHSLFTSMSKSSSEGKRLCRDRSLPLRGSVARPPECAGGSIAQ